MSLLSRRRVPEGTIQLELALLRKRLLREVDEMVAQRRVTATASLYMAEAIGRTIDDYVLYADVGRDRKKLGMEWVEKAEASVREAWGWCP